jgi:hypothetical protein
MNGELASALVKMAVSPVKADREAIARLERECGTDITKITASLENLEIITQAYKSNPHKEISKILLFGVFWSAVIGLATMFVRPSYTWCGLSLGFVAGAAGKATMRV